MGCDEYPKVESGMLVLKRKPKGNGTREAEGDIVYLNWCTKESTRGTVPELIMRDISTWCASREWNTVLNEMATPTLSTRTSSAVAMKVTMAIAPTVSTGISMVLAMSEKWK